jgi:predicted small lipoprotein YifL
MNTCRSRGSLFGAVPLLLIAFAVAGCGRTATLYQPPRVAFFPMDTAAVEHAIVTGMVRRRWVASREGPGSILGTLHLRDYTVVVRITYTKYSRKADGTEIIHKNYNSWIDNLTRDIDAELIPPAR